MATEFDATAYAARLGVTERNFPSLFYDESKDPNSDCGAWGRIVCTLPSPYSDDPRACLWEPFLMRALGWPVVYTTASAGGTKYMIRLGLRSDTGYFYTPTAALAAAFDAKEAK